jgi:hypothetical protein
MRRNGEVKRRRMKTRTGRGQRKMRKIRKWETGKRSGAQNKSQANVSEKIRIGEAERGKSGAEGKRTELGGNARPRRRLESNEITKRRKRRRSGNGKSGRRN